MMIKRELSRASVRVFVSAPSIPFPPCTKHTRLYIHVACDYNQRYVLRLIQYISFWIHIGNDNSIGQISFVSMFTLVDPNDGLNLVSCNDDLHHFRSVVFHHRYGSENNKNAETPFRETHISLFQAYTRHLLKVQKFTNFCIINTKLIENRTNNDNTYIQHEIVIVKQGYANNSDVRCGRHGHDYLFYLSFEVVGYFVTSLQRYFSNFVYQNCIAAPSEQNNHSWYRCFIL